MTCSRARSLRLILDGGAGVQVITFRRIIVYPNGHEHVEGVTPKQLPAPEPDETKVIEP